MPERFREPQRSPAEIVVETAVDRARTRLDRMLRANPDLQQFVPPGNMGRARRVLNGVIPLLRKNPQLVEQLTDVSQGEGKGKTTMLVYP